MSFLVVLIFANGSNKISIYLSPDILILMKIANFMVLWKKQLSILLYDCNLTRQFWIDLSLYLFNPINVG